MSRVLVQPVDLGCPGHFCGARNCQWRRHTQVGHYRVSSVGNYYPDGRGNAKRTPLGCDLTDFFETMVFETLLSLDPGSEGCGCRVVKSFSEIDGARYETAGAAQQGHQQFVTKYLIQARRAAKK